MTNEPIGKPIEGPDGNSFDDFDACVAHFDGDDAVDDPEAFCAWLDDEGGEALSDPNADEVLAGLEVEFVSAVGEPAQDSEWLIAKHAEDPDGDRHRWQSEATLYVRKDDTSDDADGDAKQIAFAPVLVPKEADKDGDIIPRPAIEDAAHTYLADYRKVDSDHDLRDGKGTPVESWTLKQDTSFELPDGTDSREYPQGTWVMGIKFDDDTWKRVEDGELSGLSIYGGAQPIDADELTASFGSTQSGSIYDTQTTMFDETQRSKQLDGDALASIDDNEIADALTAVADAIDSLEDRVATLEGESDVADFANDRMNGGDEPTRTQSVKSILGDDADVDRKAVREQSKSTDGDVSVDYSGITDGEAVTADASDVDAGTGTGSSANPRMADDDT